VGVAFVSGLTDFPYKLIISLLLNKKAELLPVAKKKDGTSQRERGATLVNNTQLGTRSSTNGTIIVDRLASSSVANIRQDPIRHTDRQPAVHRSGLVHISAALDWTREREIGRSRSPVKHASQAAQTYSQLQQLVLSVKSIFANASNL
jgi:hypothetical protein